jgi:hypothetical protein
MSEVEPRSELLAEAALDVFARLIEVLAKQGTLDSDEVDALVEIAKRHMRK